jgi:flavin reductase (DIM6/NTAB) family NADH-FMN oxidoreductase RutF
MAKKELQPFEAYEKFVKVLCKPGALLGVVDNEGRPNLMTISWSSIGNIWHKPICTVLVRSSRHSYTCLEQMRQFTVNAGGIPDKVLELCGTTTGRKDDKFKAAGITAAPAKKVKAPIINECAIHYECKVVNYCDINPMNLTYELIDSCYATGDFHRIFFGEIVACYGDISKL